MKCPCQDCLCVPICRYKDYYILKKCSLLAAYYYVDNKEIIIEKICKTEIILRPSRWGTVCTHKTGHKIIVVKVP